jgi:hypothetical protein
MPPSDASMERSLRENQKDFDQLRQLIMDDSSVGIVLSVSEDRTDPETDEAFRRGLTEARLERYRHLLQRLHLKGVGRDGDNVIFQAYAQGPMLHGTYKGFLCAKDPPQGIEKKPEGDGAPYCDYLFKPVQGHWYLYCTN